jgi:hypothetical protein
METSIQYTVAKLIKYMYFQNAEFVFTAHDP